MRLNLDLDFLAGAPLQLLCQRLGEDLPTTLGRVILAWAACYSRRRAELPAAHIDVAARLPGFAAAMIECDLAEPVPGGVRVKGVTGRIGFLLTAQERGRRGGLATQATRRQALGSNSLKQLEAPASTSADLGCLPDDQVLGSESFSAATPILRPSNPIATESQTHEEPDVGSNCLRSAKALDLVLVATTSSSSFSLPTHGALAGAGVVGSEAGREGAPAGLPSPDVFRLTAPEPAVPRAPRIPKERIEAAYQAYPRKEGKKAGLARLEAVLKASKDPLATMRDLETAIRNYATFVAGREFSKIKQFSTFMSSWEDYVVFAPPPSRAAEEAPPPSRPRTGPAPWVPPPDVPSEERDQARALALELAAKWRDR